MALTVSGEIFLDPNAIETMLQSSAVLGLAGHKKFAYMKAMGDYASKYIEGYTPKFLDIVDEEELTEVLVNSNFTFDSSMHTQTS